MAIITFYKINKLKNCFFYLSSKHTYLFLKIHIFSLSSHASYKKTEIDYFYYLRRYCNQEIFVVVEYPVHESILCEFLIFLIISYYSLIYLICYSSFGGNQVNLQRDKQFHITIHAPLKYLINRNCFSLHFKCMV